MSNDFPVPTDTSAEEFNSKTRNKLQNYLKEHTDLRKALQDVYYWEPRHGLQNISVVVFPKYEYYKNANTTPLDSIKEAIPDQYNLINELLKIKINDNDNDNFIEWFKQLLTYAKARPSLADYFLKEMFEKDDKQNDDGR